ncbi:HNH endonuclease signature motif containing protein [Blastococcus sp. CCUG 61487]|uniref:HNH endonuclease signature motif containing protein n=1 Tax=Blastococcus sp. CCUG 61487 TaxID=1840703 RepID=UPI0010C08ACB|nr:HNH endonuclease signature motif containing protein [Blastococcus sp. CCUG 61487]TKJ24818.1 HNH endonuclease [Blastococcus sp. CCUG 61487]
MQRITASSRVESLLADWLAVLPESDARLPVSRLGAGEVAAELGRIQRNRAREAAREAELILRLAELRPDVDDPPERGPGGRRRRSWRKTAPEFPGVSEFFPDEVAHAINLGRGTAAFRARRAFAWRENLPATFAALRRGQLDERRADVLADVLQHTTPELARAVEAALLGEAADLSLAALRRRALELLAELDADAVEQRREQAEQAADVRAYPTADGMAALTTDMTAEDAAACFAVIDALAAMAKADGDPRPIGAIRSSIHSMLILRPADHGLGGVTVNLTVTAALDGLEGASARGGEVNGFPVTAAHLRDLLARVRALGLTAPEGGSLTFALTDPHGRLLATVTAAELARLAAQGCPDHPDHPDTQPAAGQSDAGQSDAEQSDATQSGAEQSAGGESGAEQSPSCDCPVAGMPADTDAYEPRAAQRRFVTTRDRRCRAPNCGQRVGMADLDHVVPHGQGGRTTCANLCCLCRSHHRLKTFARGWTFRMDPDGTLHVTSPSGITRTTRPPGLRRPEPEPPPYEPESDPPPF